MTLWWAWWLAALVRRKRQKPLPQPKARRPKARPVPAYRRADGTDELRRIH